MKTLIRISMALVAVSAFSLSFQTLMALAVLAGYQGLAWLYPLTIDLGTVASCAAWMTSKSRQAFHLTWALLTASILLNGVEHWLVATGQHPAWWLITVIAMAPPAILGVVTHLAVGLSSADAHTASPTVGQSPMVDDVGSADTVTDLIEQGFGRRRLAATLGVSEHRAKQLLAASRNGDGR